MMRWSVTLLMFTLLTAAAAQRSSGQVLDRLKDAVDDAKSVIDDAETIRCEVQGVCGEVWRSDFFEPENYLSLAVTYHDATGRYRGNSGEGIVRSAFEGQLIENGFFLAASADVQAVQERVSANTDSWSDDRLAQLKDFVEGIDAVLVIEIEQLEPDRCEIDDATGMEITVHLSARWLNVDAGDIPWLATHSASVCEDGGAQALSAALEKTASQLAGTLPDLTEPEEGG